MKVPYLKKTKMFEFAKKICSEPPKKMKDCEYKFYRGSEWLIWYSDEPAPDGDGWLKWEMYKMGYYVSLNLIQSLESEFKSVTLERKHFHLSENLEEIKEDEL